jgi:hypothetical protein
VINASPAPGINLTIDNSGGSIVEPAAVSPAGTLDQWLDRRPFGRGRLFGQAGQAPSWEKQGVCLVGLV